MKNNFKDFIPILMVNNNPSAYYVIPVNDFPQRQTVEVNILNNHLIPGENNLEAIFTASFVSCTL